MVNMARRIGVEAYGVDLIAEGPGREHWFLTHDLEVPIQLVTVDGRVKDGIEDYYSPKLRCELITCLEVAEHISRERSEVLVETIARHFETGGLLVFSAAAPGQRGEHHTNARPAWEWREMFYEVGLSYREDYTKQLSHLWSWVAGPLMWLGANVQVFDA